MTDETREYRYSRYAGQDYARQADSAIDRIRAYIRSRRAADWGFFLVGVLVGGLLF